MAAHTWLAENTRMRKFGICTPLITLCGYIFATNASTDNRKNMLNGNMYSTRHHNMVNFGHLMAEISWQVWGTLTNFNIFCVLASLLHQRRSMQVNQTLHDVWWSPVLVHYIYIFRGSFPLTELILQVQNSLCVQVYCTALEQSVSAKLCGVGQGNLAVVVVVVEMSMVLVALSHCCCRTTIQCQQHQFVTASTW